MNSVEISVGPLYLEVSQYGGPFFVTDEVAVVSSSSSFDAERLVRVDWRRLEDWMAAEFTGDTPSLESEDEGTWARRSASPSGSSRIRLTSAGCFSLVDGPYLALADLPNRLVRISHVEHACCQQTRRRQLILAASLFLFHQHRSVILHGACGVLCEGRAAAFLGTSGAGKSTALHLCASNGEILADDLFVAALDEPAVTAYSTSFDRAYPGDCRAALAGIFLPTKAEAFGLTRLRPRDALFRYLGENQRDLGMLPVEIRRFYLPWLHQLFQTVPAYDLAFPRDYIDVDAVRAVLARPLPIPDTSPIAAASMTPQRADA